MSEQKPKAPPGFDTLTLKEAQKRTRCWRNAIRNKYPKGTKVPNGFYIRMEDIRELAKLHEYLQQEIKGVRVYFTFHHEQPAGHLNDTITAVLVPVYLGTVDETGTGAGIGSGDGIGSGGEKGWPKNDPMLMDLIVNVSTEGDDDPLAGQKVSVFDVTQPCPPICDGGSALLKS
jgi:hypothetical protein